MVLAAGALIQQWIFEFQAKILIIVFLDIVLDQFAASLANSKKELLIQLAQPIVKNVKQRLAIDHQKGISRLQAQFTGNAARLDAADLMSFCPMHAVSFLFIVHGWQNTGLFSIEKAASMLNSSPLR
jgi:hypothetical protein